MPLYQLRNLAVNRNVSCCQATRHEMTRAKIVSSLRKDDLLRDPYSGWTVFQLKKSIRERKIESSGKQCKQDLIELLKVADEHRSFRLIDLPPELRLLVYEVVVLNEQQSSTPSNPSGAPGWFAGVGSTFLTTNHRSALLQVSKMVRQEALPVYYRDSTFPVQIEYQVTSHGAHRQMHNVGLSTSTQTFITQTTEANFADIRRLEFSHKGAMIDDRWAFQIDLHRNAESYLVGGRRRHFRCYCGRCHPKIRLHADVSPSLNQLVQKVKKECLTKGLRRRHLETLGEKLAQAMARGQWQMLE